MSSSHLVRFLSATLSRGLFLLIFVTLISSSCASPNFWGASATAYGLKAQNRYIKNQKGHNPSRRFHSSSQPTFGAQDVSRK
ncbi:MAG: hypothetical protein AB7O48_05910 [Cyclobacteriaceae bacterium]